MFFSVLLIIAGGLVFYSNYEREIINVTPDIEELVLLDYHAPETDPLSHHLVVDVETSMIVEIIQTLDGETNIIFTDDRSGRFTVSTGETMKVVLRNPNGASGYVRTTFYCESWNYLAYSLVGFGTILFVLWYLRSGKEEMEEL